MQQDSRLRWHVAADWCRTRSTTGKVPKCARQNIFDALQHFCL